MAGFATGGIVFNNGPDAQRWSATATAGYYSVTNPGPITYSFDLAPADSQMLKRFMDGIVDGDEKLDPTEHPLVAVGDDIEIINLTNGDQVEGRLEDILTGDDVEYVYVINERRYYEPEWTILE